MTRFGTARVASVAVAVTAALAVAFGTTAAVRGEPTDPPREQAGLAVAAPDPVPSPTAKPSSSGALFAEPTYALTAKYPIDIVGADFDHDGDGDFAVAHERSDADDHLERGTEIAVLLADGKGKFASSRLDSYAAGLATADLDGDGNADLVAADPYRDKVTVFLGDGRGGFAAPVRHDTIGSLPGPVVTADLDSDGDLDLAVANRGSSDIAVLLGDGRGGFAYPTRFRAGVGPTALAALDLDGDRAAELVVLGYETVAVARNDGNGTFAKPVRLPGDYPYGDSLTTADVTGGAEPELLLGGRNGVTVFAADGKGGLRPVDEIEVGRSDGSDLAVRDLDGNGRADVVVADGGWNGVGVVLGRQGAGFDKPTRMRIKDTVKAVAVGDVNGDCAPDLAVASYNYARLAIYLNTRQIACVAESTPGATVPRKQRSKPGKPNPDHPGVPSFADPQVSAVGGDFAEMVSADFDNDAIPDVAISKSHSNKIAVLLGDGHGGFGRASLVTIPPKPTAAEMTGGRGMSAGMPANSTPSYDERPVGLRAGDTDSDGNLDLVVAMFGADDIAVLSGNGEGGFADPRRYSAGPGTAPIWLELTDLDRDGDLDAVTRNERKRGASVMLGDGRGAFTLTAQLPNVGQVLGRLATADIDSDGDSDVLILARGGSGKSSHGRVAVFRNDGNARFAPPTYVGAGLRRQINAPDGIAVGDLNRDGHPDLAITHAQAERVAVLLGDGRGGFTTPALIDTGGAYPYAVAIADVTGDQRPDLAVANRDSNEVVLLAADPRGGYAEPVRFPTGGRAPGSVVVVDVDDDGAADLIVANDGSGDVTVRRNTTPLATARHRA